MFKILSAYERIYIHARRSQETRRADRTTSYQRQLRLLCITWLPVEGAGQSREHACPAVDERSKQALDSCRQCAQRSS